MFLLLLSPRPLRNGNAGQMDILHGSPDNREATGLSGKGINLISPLPSVAEKAFNGIGTANILMHNQWESIKREQMLLIFTQASYGFGITRSRYLALNALRSSNASSFFSYFQIPGSSVAISCRSRWGMALITLRCLCTKHR